MLTMKTLDEDGQQIDFCIFVKMTKIFIDESKQSSMKFMKPVLYFPKLAMVDNFHEYKQKIGFTTQCQVRFSNTQSWETVV